jgi:hypothetical protein
MTMFSMKKHSPILENIVAFNNVTTNSDEANIDEDETDEDETDEDETNEDESDEDETDEDESNEDKNLQKDIQIVQNESGKQIVNIEASKDFAKNNEGATLDEDGTESTIKRQFEDETNEDENLQKDVPLSTI